LFWNIYIYMNLFELEYFSENVNLIKQKNNSKSINMIILKFIINIHNYQLNVYYNYNDNQLYI
jgi:hypothetical protein